MFWILIATGSLANSVICRQVSTILQTKNILTGELHFTLDREFYQLMEEHLISR